MIGRRGPVLAPLTLQPALPITNLRDLLRAIVQEQVTAFQQRKAEATLLRVLTPSEVDRGSEVGRIVPGGQPPDPRVVDVEASLAEAISAFKDGFYFVFVNDVQIEDPDHPLSQIHSVLFVRLTPLAGG